MNAMEVLTGHNSLETAYGVDKLDEIPTKNRRKHYWIETTPLQGDRLVTMEQNLFNGAWYGPTYSTYSPLRLLYLDANRNLRIYIVKFRNPDDLKKEMRQLLAILPAHRITLAQQDNLRQAYLVRFCKKHIAASRHYEGARLKRYSQWVADTTRHILLRPIDAIADYPDYQDIIH